jgi:hypothetical protein
LVSQHSVGSRVNFIDIDQIFHLCVLTSVIINYTSWIIINLDKEFTRFSGASHGHYDSGFRHSRNSVESDSEIWSLGSYWSNRCSWCRAIVSIEFQVVVIENLNLVVNILQVVSESTFRPCNSEELA